MSQVQLFESQFLNKLIFTDSRVAVSVYLLISVGITLFGFSKVDISLISGGLWIIVGLTAFTLAEYLVHRYVYHLDDDYEDKKNWQYLVHGIHHVFPKEHGLLALPIPVALGFNAVLFGLFFWVLRDYTYFFFPGFLSGYAAQLFIHYQVHTRKPPKNMFRYLWRHHLLHHYYSENKAFGVSTPLWDMVFGTMPRQPDSKRTKAT